MDNKRITSLEIKNTFCSLRTLDEIPVEILKIYRTGVIKHQQYNGWSSKPLNEYNYKITVSGMNVFFDTLVTMFFARVNSSILQNKFPTHAFGNLQKSQGNDFAINER